MTQELLILELFVFICIFYIYIFIVRALPPIWHVCMHGCVDRWRGRCKRLYIRESVLIPEGADDECHQPTLLEPAHGKLRTQREEVTHLVQVQRTLARHRDESWEQQTEGGKNDRKVKNRVGATFTRGVHTRQVPHEPT